MVFRLLMLASLCFSGCDLISVSTPTDGLTDKQKAAERSKEMRRNRTLTPPAEGKAAAAGKIKVKTKDGRTISIDADKAMKGIAAAMDAKGNAGGKAPIKLTLGDGTEVEIEDAKVALEKAWKTLAFTPDGKRRKLPFKLTNRNGKVIKLDDANINFEGAWKALLQTKK